MPVPPKIIELVEKFERNIDSYKSGKYNETQVRREFIDPFFKELGWDMDNDGQYAELYKDVVHEDAIKIGKTTKAPDYSFRIGGQRKFFVEAKKPFINIKDQPEASYQIRRYAWTAKLPLSILTNFEELAVFDCRIKPNKDDQSGKHRIHYYTFRQYTEKWDEIAGIFSKQAILQGAFDRFVNKGKKRGTQEVDDEFLKEIEHWREILAHNIALRNQGISQRELNFAVQMTIDRIIFLRICEDRGIENEEQLKQASSSKASVYNALKALFLKADARYNSGLFHFHKDKNWASEPDEFTTTLYIDDKPLKEIISHLYYPESPYEFSVLPADILGQVYERFLGKVIQLKGKSAIIEEKPEVKKAGGVFYTPTYIVDYIVENTLGELLKNKTPDEISQLRILDPACGSGSFLIQAYQHLLDWHVKWYKYDEEKHLESRAERERQGKIKDTRRTYKKKHVDKLIESGNGWQLAFSERLRILKNNIFGVDIDSQAIETTKLSLLLKLLEVQNHQLPTTQRVLPDLNTNIKCGNSLIGTDFYQDGQLSLLTNDENYKINAFDWKHAFPQIFQTGGFDVVIGNPPYTSIISVAEKEYLDRKYICQNYQKDLYLLFLEKYHQLLNKNAFLGVIISNTWLLSITYTEIRKHILYNYKWIKFLKNKGRVFDATVNTHVFLAKKGPTKNSEFIVEQELNGKILNSYPLNTDLFSNDGKPINIDFNKAQHKLAIRLFKKFKPLKHYFDVFNGIKPFEEGKGTPPQTSQTMREKPFVVDGSQPSKKWSPLLRGSLIQKYQNLWSNNHWILYGPWLAAPRKDHIFKEEKLIFRQTGDSLIGAYIPEYFYSRDNTHIILKKRKTQDLILLLTLLNSTLGDFLYAYINPEKGEPLAQVKKSHIESFPIFQEETITQKYKIDLSGLGQAMIKLKKQEPKTEQEKNIYTQQITLINREIDQLIYKIYQLTTEEIALVETFQLGQNEVSI